MRNNVKSAFIKLVDQQLQYSFTVASAVHRKIISHRPIQPVTVENEKASDTPFPKADAAQYNRKDAKANYVEARKEAFREGTFITKYYLARHLIYNLDTYIHKKTKPILNCNIFI